MMKKISTVFMLLCFVWGLTGAMAQDNPQGPKLSGTPIGSPNVDYSTGQTSSTVNTPACAFDGDLNTYYASYDRSFT